MADTDRPTPQPLAYATPRPQEGQTYWLALIVFAAVMIRIAFSLSRPMTTASLTALPDQLEYLHEGEAILHGEGMSFVDPEFDQRLYAFRMPGYPLFVAACGTDFRVIRAAQAVLDASAVIAIYLTARRLASEQSALLAAGIVAFNPYLVFFASLILSETLFTAMLAWGVCGLLSKKALPRVGGVLILLLSVYVRPSAIGLGVIAVAPAFVWATTWRRAIGATTIGGAALIVVLLPWAIRNRVVLSDWVWTTTNGGYTAYDSFNPNADGSSNQSGFRTPPEVHVARPTTQDFGDPIAIPDVPQPLHEWQAWRNRGEVSRSQTLSEMAWDYATTHPVRVVSLAFAKLGRLWSPVPLSADFGGKWEYVAVGGLYVVPLFLTAIVGIFRGGFGWRSIVILLLPAIYFTAVHSLAVGSLRYRVPCDVPLAVLAAAGVMSFTRPVRGAE